MRKYIPWLILPKFFRTSIVSLDSFIIYLMIKNCFHINTYTIGTQTHRLVLEGLFGPSYKVTRTAELMEKGHVSKLDIRCLVLKHTPQIFETYEDEVQFIITHDKRNNFIKKSFLTAASVTAAGAFNAIFSRHEEELKSVEQVGFEHLRTKKSNVMANIVLHRANERGHFTLPILEFLALCRMAPRAGREDFRNRVAETVRMRF